MGKSKKRGAVTIHKPRTQSDFLALHNSLSQKGYIALDVLKSGRVRDISLAVADAANSGARDMANMMGCGAWSSGPLSKVAWSFDGRTNAVEYVEDKDGEPLGLGYVKWGAGDNIPSVIPPLAMSSPYTAAPLRYIADLTTGLGVRFMYRFPDGELCEFKDAGEILLDRVEKAEKQQGQQAGTDKDFFDVPQQQTRQNDVLKRAKEDYEDWQRTWYGYDEEDATGDKTHVPGAKEFLEENNLDLHFIQCEQDDASLDIYFPTVGLQRGRRGAWKPKIVQVSMLPAHSTRLEKMNEYRHINHVYFSDSLRTKGVSGTTITAGTATTDQNFTMYPAAMPQHTLSDLRYIVDSNQRTRIKDRPTWICCPTFYPSGQKPYYPQPHWWSVFTSKAFDFAATILYDKYKARENNTTWGRIIYISVDYLDRVFADEGYQGNPEKQQEFIDQLDQSMEDFLQQRENNGKAMRQWMWTGPDGKEHKNVEIVDIKETTNDAVKAGKEELEMSTNPIFLAMMVDPRDVGVPMVSASNGGTALREIRLMKQQQLSPKQRLYLNFLNIVPKFNGWSERGAFYIKQQTFTTLDRSKTGIVDTIAGEEA